MVAAHAITAGAVITATDLRPKAYDAAAPDGALLSREAALGRVAGRNFAAGEVLLADDLRDAAAAGIGARVPLGERAFSIRVVEDEIVGGFLQSGDHVDIIRNNSRFGFSQHGRPECGGPQRGCAVAAKRAGAGGG